MITKKVESYQDLVVWQKSHDLVKELYQVKFSKKDNESFASQIRNIAASIPMNIAIGFKKRGRQPKLHYYRSALTSLEQLSYLLLLAKDLSLFKSNDFFTEEIETIERMLKRLIRSNAQS